MSWTKYDDLHKILKLQFQVNRDKKNPLKAPIKDMGPSNDYNHDKGYSSTKIQPSVETTNAITKDCSNTPAIITSLTTGVIAHVPVVLGILTLHFNLDSIIDLPMPALDIKDIKNHITITQSMIIENTNLLFIKGYVRKSIDFSTRTFLNHHSVSGDIRHFAVDIPFKCNTPVTFNGISPITLKPSTTEKSSSLSGEQNDFHQTSTEFFNDMPFCTLLSSRIVELNEHIPFKNMTGATPPFTEMEFKQIQDKMVIYLTIKVLQHRQVAIPSTMDMVNNPVDP